MTLRKRSCQVQWDSHTQDLVGMTEARMSRQIRLADNRGRLLVRRQEIPVQHFLRLAQVPDSRDRYAHAQEDEGRAF
jgi:hypothetical protein